MDYKKQEFSSQFVFKNPNEMNVAVAENLKFVIDCNTSQTQLMRGMFEFINFLKF